MVAAEADWRLLAVVVGGGSDEFTATEYIKSWTTTVYPGSYEIITGFHTQIAAIGLSAAGASTVGYVDWINIEAVD